MMPLADLLADGPITAFAFRTGGGTSRAVRSFIVELAAVLSTTPKKPLIIASDHELTAIFRPFGYVDMRKVTGGKRFVDIHGYDGSVYIELQHGADDVRSHEPCNIVLPENGKWDGGRTPDNTVRSALPVFDSEAVSKGVEALLERWLETGKLVDVERDPSSYDTYAPDMDYTGEVSIANPPGDLDPTDSRRRDSEFIRKLRVLREKVLGRDTGAIIEGPAGRVSKREFDAA